jgi:hypothetical protein
MLLNGYGYNWYRRDNRMRADDLLIRSRASEHLENAVAKLRELETRFRREYLPPPTRARPDPDPRHLAAARRFAQLANRVLDIDTRLRGAAVPPNDKIWQRHRDEIETLERLGECDAVLVAGAKELYDCVPDALADAGLDPASEAQIDHCLAELAGALAQRNEILSIHLP